MRTIEIRETHNGYVVKKDESEYVYRSVDILAMLEFVGADLYGKKVRVEER